MKNIAEQITEGLDRFYKAFQKKRVLKSLEEISATTNDDDLASATAVAALSNKLAGFQPIVDPSTGEIKGYKTDVGGADAVFPFNSAYKINCSITTTMTNGNAQILNKTVAGYMVVHREKSKIVGLSDSGSPYAGGALNSPYTVTLRVTSIEIVNPRDYF